jgi:hypothetical protein
MVRLHLPSKRREHVLVILLFTALVLLVCALAYLSKHPSLPKTSDNQIANTAVSSEILGQLATVFPNAKDQQQITVTHLGNPKLLKSVAGLDQAHPGDYLIQYDYLNHAVLWRPSTHKIINIIDTVNIIDVVVSAKVDISFATQVASLIQQSSPTIFVRIKQDPVNNPPQNTIVVNNPRYKDSADSLAKDLDGIAGPLPSGEKADPEASLQIFLGQPFTLKSVSEVTPSATSQ